MNRYFGYAKVRYRGLWKNTQRISLLLGFANLVIAGRYSIRPPDAGEVRPEFEGPRGLSGRMGAKNNGRFFKNTLSKQAATSLPRCSNLA